MFSMNNIFKKVPFFNEGCEKMIYDSDNQKSTAKAAKFAKKTQRT